MATSERLPILINTVEDTSSLERISPQNLVFNKISFAIFGFVRGI